MSLDKAAKYLESHGRGNDSVLVHMSPREVQSLQTLAKATGGSLTINPHTGLAEAGWLDSLLPTIAGVGLSFIPGVGPLAAAGLVGAFQTARTGDIGKGLMAGLGAYGGAGLMSGLATTGAGALPEATSAATTTGTGMGGTGGFTEYQELLGSTPQTAAPPEWMAQQPTMSTAEANKIIGSSGTVTGGSQAAPVTLQNVGEGFKQAFQPGGASTLYSNIQGGTLPALATTAAAAATPQYEVPKVEEKPSSGRWLSKDFKGYTPPRPDPYYAPAGLGYTGYAAEGGSVDDIKSYAIGGTTTATASDGVRRFNSGDGGIFSQNFANEIGGQTNAFGNIGIIGKLKHMIDANQGGSGFGGFKQLSPNFGNAPIQNPSVATNMPYRPQGLGYDQGGLAMGGQPGQMYPGSDIQSQYATPTQAPASAMTGTNNYEMNLDPYTGEPIKMAVGGVTKQQSMRLGDGIFRDTDPDTASLDAYRAALLKEQKISAGAKMPKQPKTTPKTNMEYLGDIKTGVVGAAAGGQLGSYSDGGRMLKGPGDGMSDSIPGVIGAKQPARLADGEFVVPADVVSHLGNGSTDAGAKKLYSMMDKVRTARTGNKKQGKKINPDKFMPS